MLTFIYEIYNHYYMGILIPSIYYSKAFEIQSQRALVLKEKMFLGKSLSSHQARIAGCSTLPAQRST